MRAILNDVEDFLSVWKPEGIKFSENAIEFYSNGFNFIVRPYYNDVAKKPYLEIEMKVVEL